MALYLTEAELTAIDEGKQAEEYKARKAKENSSDNSRRGKTFMYDGKYQAERHARGDNEPSGYHTYPDRYNKTKDKYDDEKDKAMKMVANKKKNTTKKEITEDDQVALDAAHRHIRRHPEQYKESAGIFESVEII